MFACLARTVFKDALHEKGQNGANLHREPPEEKCSELRNTTSLKQFRVNYFYRVVEYALLPPPIVGYVLCGVRLQLLSS